jgi:L-alanine-DL-glutamate epimerase-like enolase superfamily enzyme
VPVATGEIEAGRWRFKELLDKDAAAILQADAAVCGGITEYRRIAALADAYGVTMCPHWFHDLHVHLVGAGANFRDLIDTQLELQGGGLALPAGAGLGYQFAPDALAHYAADDWG